jgi:hypothetical protein
MEICEGEPWLWWSRWHRLDLKEEGNEVNNIGKCKRRGFHLEAQVISVTRRQERGKGEIKGEGKREGEPDSKMGSREK